MSYIYYIEEMAIEEGMKEGIEKGMKEGMEKGLKEGLQLALKVKFGKKGVEFYEKYIKKEETLERLRELMKKLENAKDIMELM